MQRAARQRLPVRRAALAAAALLALTSAAPAADTDPDLHAPPVARRTADYLVVRRGGLVTRIEIRPLAGGRIVASDFSSDPQHVADERLTAPDAGCTAALCRTTCQKAGLARPFRRLAGFDSDGRRLWQWTADADQDEAVRLAPSGLDDCLSPDGRYLLVLEYSDGGQIGAGLMGPAVLRLAPPAGYATLPELGSAKDGVDGWVAGQPATLEIEPDAGVEDAPRRLVLAKPRP